MRDDFCAEKVEIILIYIKKYLQIIGENDSKSHQNQAPGVQNHHIPRKTRFRQKHNLFLVHGHIGPQTIVMDEIN